MYFFGEAASSMAYIIFAPDLKTTRIEHIRLKNLVSAIVLWGMVLIFRSYAMLYISMFMIGVVNGIGVVQGYAFIME